MALTNLTPLTLSQYRALSITPISPPPGISSSGNPDSNVGIQLGGWVGTSVMAFTVTDAANTDSSVAIDATTANQLDVNVRTDTDPGVEITYWTVDMGAGASGTSWQISYDVADNNVSTGKWVFTKGKAADPRDPKN